MGLFITRWKTNCLSKYELCFSIQTPHVFFRVFSADDDRISTLVRGGPNAHVLTSWLQIQSLQRNDQGTYTCVASNALGKVEKSCIVSVEGKHSEKKF